MNALDDARALATALFDNRNRLYELHLDTDDGPARLAVERWHGSARLSGDRRLHLDCLSPDAHIDLGPLLGRPLRLTTRMPDGTAWTQSGLVRSAMLLGANGGLARYRLVASSWWWCLGEGRRSRVFQDRSVLEILDTVFADYRPVAHWVLAPEVAGTLAGRRPRSYCVQYRESDQAFCARLLAEEGLGFAVEDDADAPAGHRLRIFADSTRLAHTPVSAAGGGIRFHRADATETADAVQQFQAGRRLVPGEVTRLSHDYRSMRASHAAVPVANALDGVRLEDYDAPGAYAFADAAEGDELARRHAEALEAAQATWRGAGSVRGFDAGHGFTLHDAPTAPEHDGCEWLLSRVHHRGINNLPNTVVAAVQAQLPALDDEGHDEAGEPGNDLEIVATEHLRQRAQASGYANAFDVLPRDTPWRQRLLDDGGARLNPRPTVPGPQTALVVGPDGSTQAQGHHEMHCDALGRLRLRMHWQDGDASCWVRVAQRYAGPGVGAQFLPRIGQEVLVDFLDGDIDRPIIIGALYNGRGEGGIAPTPGGQSGAEPDADLFASATDHGASAQGNVTAGHAPAWHGASADPAGHRNAAALSGWRSQEFGGSGHNQLVFDDSDGQGRIQMATSVACSQLNLGHLIHQADNHRGSFRGEGFELRTDACGAVRAEAGLLVDSGATASMVAGDNVPGLALLRQMVALAEGFDQAAGTHRTVALASHRGAAAADATATDGEHAPATALLRSARTQVPAGAYDDAINAAPAKNDSGGEGQLPHSGDAQLTLLGRAGLGLVAGQSLQLHSGDVLQLASGADSHASVVGDTRIHAGQAIGWLAGATGQGEGLHLIAANGALDVQAQDDTLALRAKDDVRIASASAELEAAAGKRIHLAVAGGASITLEGGNLTIACPGQITVHASQHSFVGPAHLSREMNSWPKTEFNERFQLRFQNGEPASGQRYEVVRSDGARIHGITDADGFMAVQQGNSPEGLSIRILGSAQEGTA